jgi:threonine synthase
MDIEVSSNFERALYLASGGNSSAVRGMMASLKQAGGFTVAPDVLAALRSDFASGMADEAATRATIARTLAETGELLCPHTAVGVHVAEHHLRPGLPMVTLATAHPAKFPDAVQAATGLRPPLPSRMADLYERDERVTAVANDLTAIETLIRRRRAR